MAMITTTRKLREALEAQDAYAYRRGDECLATVFPEKFVEAVRYALNVGMSCEHLVAFIRLAAGLYDCLDVMDGEQMISRSNEIVQAIQGDVNYQSRMENFRRRLQREREVSLQPKRKGLIR